MLSIFRRLMKSEQGATAIEYTLIAALISVAAIVAFRSVGTSVTNLMSNVAAAMRSRRLRSRTWAVRRRAAQFFWRGALGGPERAGTGAP